jgi:thiol-disulfide isomerase/thioredoxin
MAFSKPSSIKPGGRRSFWTPGRIGLTLAGVVLISALGSSSCNSNEVATNNAPANRAVNAPAANVSPAANAPSPPAIVSLPPDVRDIKLQTLDGGSLKLSDYTDKVIVMNLWATWCGPCRLEMPELVKMSKEYKSRGLVVIGVATSYNEHNDQAHVKEFIQSQSVPYKIIWDDGTLSAPMVQAVQGRAVIPQSFVISRDGRILKHFQGFSQYSTPQLMRQAIEEALNEKGKA